MDEKQYCPGTLESILEDRLADLLDHHTISIDMFVPLVIADMKQDGVRMVPRDCTLLVGGVRWLCYG